MALSTLTELYDGCILLKLRISVLGTQILLRNSNIAGQMKLMIDNDIPKKNRWEAVIKAANCMKKSQKVSSTTANIRLNFSKPDI